MGAGAGVCDSETSTYSHTKGASGSHWTLDPELGISQTD